MKEHVKLWLARQLLSIFNKVRPQRVIRVLSIPKYKSNKLFLSLALVMPLCYALECTQGIYAEGNAELKALQYNEKVSLIFTENSNITFCKTVNPPLQNSEVCSNLIENKAGFIISNGAERNVGFIKEELERKDKQVYFRICSNLTSKNNIFINENSQDSWVEADGTVIGFHK